MNQSKRRRGEINGIRTRLGKVRWPYSNSNLATRTLQWHTHQVQECCESSKDTHGAENQEVLLGIAKAHTHGNENEDKGDAGEDGRNHTERSGGL